MAQIERTIDGSNTRTIITVRGTVAPDDVISALDAFYGSVGTPHLVWDFSNADLAMSEAERLPLALSRIIERAKSYAHRREGGRTAIVLPDVVGFGIGRMYEIMSEVKSHSIAHGVFKSLDEAVKWLGSPGPE